MKRIITLLILFFLASSVYAQENYDLSTVLMRSTYKIEGPCPEGTQTGTCFIIGKPLRNKPDYSNYVLVTAAHVLKKIQSDNAILYLRKKEIDTYSSKIPYSIRIRSDGKPLWKEHPNADIAVMYVNLRSDMDISLVSINFLAMDEELKKIEIRPGDELFVLGFPVGCEANDAGFPILRSANIASYPILPTKITKTMLIDFEVFTGNSGGPVFLISQGRYYEGSFHIHEIHRYIIGLVTEEYIYTQETKTLFESKTTVNPLKLGVVTHASLIKEAIESLPQTE
jgi:S1-C subfamily serine protease